MPTHHNLDRVQLEQLALRRRVLMAREDPVEFCRFIGRKEGDKPIRMGPVHTEWHRLLSQHDRFVLFAPVGHGKMLEISTSISTPNGFKKLEDVCPGDFVIGMDGKPTRVTWVSDITTPEVSYKLTLRDGSAINACSEHQWLAWTKDDRRHKKPPRTVTTQDIVSDFRCPDGSYRWRLPFVEPVQYPERELPVDPYVLGAWLGDGLASGGQMTIGDDDWDGITPLLAEHYDLGSPWRSYDHKCQHVTLYGLVKDLRDAGVLNDKHIPERYLLGSVEQRRALLAGLMDTDGSVDPKRGRCRFVNTNKRLVDGIRELIRSLGMPAYMTSQPSVHKGKAYGECYTVSWTPYEPVFRCERKAAMQRKWLDSKQGAKHSREGSAHTVVGWLRVESKPMRCIAVEDDHHSYCAGREYIVTHNSNHVTRWRLEWEMGRNPDIRIGVVSVAKSGVPAKFMGAIRGDIEDNKRLRLVFPRLRPAQGAQRLWSAGGINVQRGQVMPDPTLQTFGLYGKILGSRLDLIVLDDVCNLENTLTQQSRDKMWDWLSGEVFSRLPPDGSGRVWSVGHVWDHDDVMERMRKLPGWHHRKYSAWVPREDNPREERPLIPELWSRDRLARREAELGPIMGSLMLRNQVPDRSAGRIRLEWFGPCLQRGEGMGFLSQWNPADAPVYTGVDVATGEGNDKTCAITAVVLPDGSRRIIDIRTGDWTGPQIIEELKDISHRYGSQIAVESNAAQRFLHQFASDLACMALVKHETGVNKRSEHFGVEALGMEISQGKWAIPSTMDGVPERHDRETDPAAPSELAMAIRELVAYTPDRKVHTGDRAMAWWILRERIRQSSAGTGYTADELTDDMLDWDQLVR